MPISTTKYGSVAEGDTYFSTRLNAMDWAGQPTEKKDAALLAASRSIEALGRAGKFAGYKTPVYNLLQTNPNATAAEIAAADATQELSFPRNGDVAVPETVLVAVYEEAHERLRGRDPALEVENFVITSDGAGSTRMSYDRTGRPPRHLAHGLCSFIAWQNLFEHLGEMEAFRIERT